MITTERLSDIESILYHHPNGTHAVMCKDKTIGAWLLAERTLLELIALARWAFGAKEVLESIAAEKCKGSFEETLHKLQHGELISIIDTDTRLAREAMKSFPFEEKE